MSSSHRIFKCKVCKEKKKNPSDRDVSICKDCDVNEEVD
jgi:hypothetical protein